MIPSPTITEQLKNLEQLQQIDLQMDDLKKNQTELPADLKVLDQEILKIQQTIDMKNKSLDEIKKSKAQAQAALDLNQSRMTRSQSKLEQVKNSQEFQAASKEIDQLKKLNESLFEQLKKDQLVIDHNEQEIQGLSQGLQVLQMKKDEGMKVLLEQNKNVLGEIVALDHQKQEYLGKIDLRLLNQYNRIRLARKGIGAACLVAGRCKACNMMIPAQMYNEIQKGNILHSCPSCNRILFISAQEKPSTETPSIS